MNSGDSDINGPPAFVAEGVCKRLGQTAVLADLSFRIEQGQHVAIIGPSGAGKTTLLRLLAAVLWPSTGAIQALGCHTSALRGRQLRAFRQRVGFLYQNDNLIPGLRVAHNVLMGRLGSWSLARSLLSLIWPQDVDRASKALAEVELGDKLWALPGTLSGGEQQRVAIARLLVQQSEAILADEPVSSLDIRLGREMILTLSRLAASRGATLVVSLHDLNMLGDHFDSILALRQGRLHWQGKPAQLTSALVREIYGAEYQSLRLDELNL